jgi:hypothetical protein
LSRVAGRHKVNHSTTFAGEIGGVNQADVKIQPVSLLEYDLGYFDDERGRVEPGPKPFTPDKVLSMCPEEGVNRVTV